MRKVIIMAYMQGVFDTLTEGTEEERFKKAIEHTIAYYRGQPVYRSEINELEKEYLEHGVAKVLS